MNFEGLPLDVTTAGFCPGRPSADHRGADTDFSTCAMRSATISRGLYRAVDRYFDFSAGELSWHADFETEVVPTGTSSGHLGDELRR